MHIQNLYKEFYKWITEFYNPRIDLTIPRRMRSKFDYLYSILILSLGIKVNDPIIDSDPIIDNFTLNLLFTKYLFLKSITSLF